MQETSTWHSLSKRLFTLVVAARDLASRWKRPPQLTPRQNALQAWAQARREIAARPEVAKLESHEREREIIRQLFRKANNDEIPSRPRRTLEELGELTFSDWEIVRDVIVDDVVWAYRGLSEEKFMADLDWLIETDRLEHTHGRTLFEESREIRGLPPRGPSANPGPHKAP